MPSVADFEQQAVHNAATAKLLANAEIYDWAVTALFYAALQKVQIYFAERGPSPKTHRKRETLIQQSAELSPIEESYLFLRIYSEDARYECQQYSRDEFLRLESVYYQPLVTYLDGLRRVQ